MEFRLLGSNLFTRQLAYRYARRGLKMGFAAFMCIDAPAMYLDRQLMTNILDYRCRRVVEFWSRDCFES